MKLLHRLALVTLLLSAGFARTAKSQVPGQPPAATPQGLNARIQSMIQGSGLTMDQIQARLRAEGYSPSLLDPYARGTADSTAVPSDNVFAAMRALGLVDTVQLDTLRSSARVPRVQRERADSVFVDSLLRAMKDDSTRAAVRRVLRSREAQRAQVDSGFTRFGSELFERGSTQFDANSVGAAGPNYRLGPGDRLVLFITGDTEKSYQLEVTREGFVVIPDVGQVSVANLTLGQLEDVLYTRLGRVLSGIRRGPGATTRFSINLARLGANQLVVAGDVSEPGSYTLSRAATAFTALNAAGGPSDRGSLRNVQVRRGDQIVTTIDVYDYALKGDASRDVRLENGDIIFVPPRGPQVRVAGAVLRPATYELARGETLADLLRLAGGFTAEADRRRLQINRIVPPAERTTTGSDRKRIDVASALLATDAGPREPLFDGDVVHVFSVPRRISSSVTVNGNVWNPGAVAFTGGMHLSDALHRVGGLKPDSYLGQVLISRLRPDSTREMLRTELRDTTGAATNDPALRDADEITVFSLTEYRPKAYVTVNGAVKTSGRIPYRDGMTLRDAVLLAGGLRENALLTEAEVARVPENRASGVMATTQRVPLDSTYLFSRGPDGRYIGPPGIGVPSSSAPDVRLSPYDAVLILQQPNWEFERAVTIRGEVRYPGRYQLKTVDDRLSDIIERAGGLTPKAYADGVVFTRSRNGIGRIGLDLPSVLRDKSDVDNIELADGDQIVIPAYEPVVSVRGALNSPVAVAYVAGEDMDYYIRSAGGGTIKADTKKAFVTQSNGKVESRNTHFFVYHSVPKPTPGSTVFVPEKDMTAKFDLTNFVATSTSVLTSLVAIVALLRR